RGIPERLEEGIQWVQSTTNDELRAAVRDLLLMNRVIATWPPKPKQTTVLVENLNEVPQANPSSPGRGLRDGQPAGAPGEGPGLEPPSFPLHNDLPQAIDVAQLLPSGVSLVARNGKPVFVSGSTLTTSAD